MILKEQLAKTGMADPIGILLTASVGMLGVFGVPELAGLDENEVASLLGFLGMIVTALRAMHNVKVANQVESDSK